MDGARRLAAISEAVWARDADGVGRRRDGTPGARDPQFRIRARQSIRYENETVGLFGGRSRVSLGAVNKTET